MEYRDLHEILRMDTEIRVHDAAAKLIHQIAFAETRKALDGLKTAGVIGEALAVQLAMELNQAILRPVRKDGQKEEPASRPAVRGEPVPPQRTGPAAPETEAAPERKKAKPGPKRAGMDVVRFCPVCQERGIQTELSVGAVGCKAHWREVKKRKNL